MRHAIIISTIFLLIGCADNKEKETVSDRLELIPEPDKNLKEKYLKNQTDTTSCDKTALDFFKLADKTTQADFFLLLDSVRKVQYPKNDQDTTAFIDLTPKLLSKFLKDLNKDELLKTGSFEKEYYFNIAPAKYTDSKKCKDKIIISYDKKTCSFELSTHNEFFAEWCQESSVVYFFKINGGKISDFSRNEAG